VDDVIDEVTRLLDEIRGKVDELTRTINETLAKVPGWASWVVDRVRDGWDAFCEKLGQFWDWFTDKLAYAGDPGGLSDLARRWADEVAAPVSAQTHEIEAGDLLVDDRWQGDAADQYRQRVPDQKLTLKAVRSEYVAALTSALNSMSSAITVFWWGVAGALVSLALGIVGAVTAAGGVVTAPAAPVIAGLGVAGALIALGTTLYGLINEATSTELALDSAKSYGLTSWPSFAVS
jgi:hypothetical protein